jgi:hypothetical protein
LIEPTTIEERYSRATHTSHLEVITRKQGDADVLMAAAFASKSTHDRYDMRIGAKLFRLISEFDEARSDARLARRNSIRKLAEAKEASKSKRKTAAEDAEALRAQETHDAKMAKAFILLRLKSLADTREAFGRWVMMWAVKRNFMPFGAMPTDVLLMPAWREQFVRRETAVMGLAGKMLDVIIDPLCPHCDGRAFTGGYSGTPQVKCRECCKPANPAHGRRDKLPIGLSAEQHQFSGYLMAEVEKLLRAVEADMSKRLRDPDRG